MTTWDPNNKSATETLSGGNLIATSSGVGTVAATRVLTSPKSYFEITITTLLGTVAVGLVNRSYNMASGTILGTDVNGVGFKSTGVVVINNITIATIQTYLVGAVIGVAVDLARQLIWFTTNGTTWNNDIIGNQNPVGDIGGISLATMTLGSALPAAGGSITGDVLVATFLAGSFVYTPPTGYISPDTCGATAKNSNVAKSVSFSTTGGTTNRAVTTNIAARSSVLLRYTVAKPSSSNSPVPIASVLAGGILGTAYSETIGAASGTGTPPFTFSVLSGSLPTSLSLNSSTGVISGTPTVIAMSSFAIAITDSLNFVGSQGFVISVTAAASGTSNYGFSS